MRGEHTSTSYALWSTERDTNLKTLRRKVLLPKSNDWEEREEESSQKSHEARMEKLRSLQSHFFTLQLGLHCTGVASKKKDWELKDKLQLRNPPQLTYPPAALNIRAHCGIDKLKANDAVKLDAALVAAAAPPGAEIAIKSTVLFTPAFLDYTAFSSDNSNIIYSAAKPKVQLHLGREIVGKEIPCWTTPESASLFGFSSKGPVASEFTGPEERDEQAARDGVRPRGLHRGRIRCVLRVVAAGKGLALHTSASSPAYSADPSPLCLLFGRIRPVALHSIHFTDEDERILALQSSRDEMRWREEQFAKIPADSEEEEEEGISLEGGFYDLERVPLPFSREMAEKNGRKSSSPSASSASSKDEEFLRALDSDRLLNRPAFSLNREGKVHAQRGRLSAAKRLDLLRGISDSDESSSGDEGKGNYTEKLQRRLGELNRWTGRR